MNAFTPLAGAAGGILIGLAAWVFYRGVGRIAGISGILAGVASGEGRRLKALFVIGLLAGAATVYFGFGQPPAVVSQADRMWLILAGLLVGFGTRLGSGCTSLRPGKAVEAFVRGDRDLLRRRRRHRLRGASCHWKLNPASPRWPPVRCSARAWRYRV